MGQGTTAGVQDLRKAEESRSDHLGEGKCTERARLETNGCILSGAGTPKREFRVRSAYKTSIACFAAMEAAETGKVIETRRME